ncbi:beige protein [Schizosaccharomyces japonicus yFS275]|uniref:Beige protein homolog 1 n=1 Tax=Schizosaccharomyces japonicus (strain yFS275 / FY16936) TaxID=402676 RepID=B6JYR8_SCHJY|nr:beige protein [Schizosaccharomyces japonicus yFS275]EEB06686.2 beige protein [Schizosaccharomyces japonicus yFS275]
MSEDLVSVSSCVESFHSLSQCTTLREITNKLTVLYNQLKTKIPRKLFPQLFITNNGFQILSNVLARLNSENDLSLEIFEKCLRILSLATSYTVLRSWLLVERHVEYWLANAIVKLLPGDGAPLKGHHQRNTSLDAPYASLLEKLSTKVLNAPKVDQSARDAKSALLLRRVKLSSALISFVVNDSDNIAEAFTKIVPEDVPAKDIYASFLTALVGKPLFFPDLLPLVLDILINTELLPPFVNFLCETLKQSVFNRIQIASSSALDFLMVLLFPQSEEPLDESLANLLIEITELSARYGVSNSTLTLVLEEYKKNPRVWIREWIQKTMDACHPPCFYLNPNLKGYASVDYVLNNIKLDDNGYTMSFWLNVDDIPLPQSTTSCSPITLISLADVTKQCLFRVVYFADDRTIRFQFGDSLQNSATHKLYDSSHSVSQKHSLNSSLYGNWHLISFVHVKTSNTLVYFIDGHAIEYNQCPYPFSPSILQPYYISVGANPKQPETQSDALSDSISRFSISKQSTMSETDTAPDTVNMYPEIYLGMVRMHSLPLSSSHIALMYVLGPGFAGSFRENLADYMIYSASTFLNLTFGDKINSSNRDYPSDSLVFVSNANDYVNIGDEGLHKLCSPDTLNVLDNLKSQFYSRIYLNRAATSYDHVFSAAHLSFGVSSGIILPCVSQNIIEAAYNIGGISVLLDFVRSATDDDNLLFSLELFCKAIDSEWRFAEAAEQGHAYEILASILRSKSDSLINEKTLLLISQYCGLSLDPVPSVIKNPLLFHTLFLDFELWAKSLDLDVRLQHLTLLLSLTENNPYAAFNVKRLSKMHLLKKLLFSLRNFLFSVETLPVLKMVFHSIFKYMFTTETIRMVATFVVYSTQNSKRVRRGSRASDLTQRHPLRGTRFTIKQAGRMLCESFIDFLTNSENGAACIRRFSSMITSMWLLFLLREHDTNYFLCGLKLFTQLIRVMGFVYIAKLQQKFYGLRILGKQLAMHVNDEETWILLVSMFLGYGVHKIQRSSEKTLKEKLNELLSSGLEDAYPVMEVFNLLTQSIEYVLKDNFKVLVNPVPSCIEYATSVTEFLLSLQTSFFLDPTHKALMLEEFYRLVMPYTSLYCYLSPADELEQVRDTLEKRLPRTTSLSLLSAGMTGHHRRVSSSTFGKKVRSLSTSKIKYLNSLDNYSKLEVAPSKTSSFLKGCTDLRNTMVDLFPECRVSELLRNVDNLLLRIYLQDIFCSAECQNFNPIPGIYLQAQRHQRLFVTAVSKALCDEILQVIEKLPDLMFKTWVLSNLSIVYWSLTCLWHQGYINSSIFNIRDFGGHLLEKWHNESKIHEIPKTVTQIIARLHASFVHSYLLAFVPLKETSVNELMSILKQLKYWQSIFFQASFFQLGSLDLIWYVLYQIVLLDVPELRTEAVDVWRIFYLHFHANDFLSNRFKDTDSSLQHGLSSVLETDSRQFLTWFDENRINISKHMMAAYEENWQDFVKSANKSKRDKTSATNNTRYSFIKRLIATSELESQKTFETSASIESWMMNLYALECSRFRKMYQDQSDQDVFIRNALQSIENELTLRSFLFKSDDILWELDCTEGAERTRKRLMPCLLPKLKSEPKSKRASGNGQKYNAPTSEPGKSIKDELSQAKGLIENAKPVDLDADESTADKDTEDLTEEEEEKDDKNQSAMHVLVHGDLFEKVFNVGRVVGLDAVEGILVLGKFCIYLMDSFFFRSDHEIVDVRDDSVANERDPFLRLLHEQDINHRLADASTERSVASNWHWLYGELISVMKRCFLLRDVGLELFFKDGRSFLVILPSIKARDSLHQMLLSRNERTSDALTLNSPLPKEVGKKHTMVGALGSRLVSAFSIAATHPATKQWERHEISNFHYLQIVNTLAGRTYNDLTQYPVFPWVIADYESEELDFSDPKTFRDLSKPMGAQTPERKEQFMQRYQMMLGLNDSQQKPFHYGTHYSSAMIVTSFLIRLRPFVDAYLALQGGQFDHADRLFFSIKQTWDSASRDNMADVRELIPEFFYLSEMFVNLNHFDFGVRQSNGMAIDNVVLPPWAKGDPMIFVQKNREALESDYVSAHLHEWIDLIFGCDQKGPSAVNRTNVFHNLSYQGSIDLENIDNELELAATVGIIHNFGQTPNQIFKRPHPPRGLDFTDRATGNLIFGRFEDSTAALIQSYSPVFEITGAVNSISYQHDVDELHALPYNIIQISRNLLLRWGRIDNAIELMPLHSEKRTQLFEELHVKRITHLQACDERSFITVAKDMTLKCWLISHAKPTTLTLKCVLSGHQSEITAVCVCKTFSIIVSGDETGHLIIWDMNRCESVNSMRIAKAPIQTITVNPRNGDIAITHGVYCVLISINGDKLIADRLTRSFSGENEAVTATCFYTGVHSEWLHRELLVTGHANGVIRIWEKKQKDRILIDTVSRFDSLKKTPNWRYQLVREFQPTVGNRRSRKPLFSKITCVYMNGNARMLFTGDVQGRVFAWSLPDTGSSVHLDHSNSAETCVLCDTRFSLMEWRCQCRACGNSNICNDCIVTLPNSHIKVCRECSRRISFNYKNY